MKLSGRNQLQRLSTARDLIWTSFGQHHYKIRPVLRPLFIVASQYLQSDKMLNPGDGHL